MAKKFLEWLIQESESSELLDKICSSYESKFSNEGDKKFLGTYHGIKIYSVDRKSLELEKPEWRTYIGSHHWGKQTDYIPEDEIWISDDLDSAKFRKVLNHELVEREAMRALEEEKGMDSQEAWIMAHMWVKQMGF
jgi:hypothetical protein